MSKKEKMQNEELEQVSGGGRFLEDLHMYRSGPYKCPWCGEDYYLGDEEMSVGMCQKCFHDADRLQKRLKNPSESQK